MINDIILFAKLSETNIADYGSRLKGQCEGNKIYTVIELLRLYPGNGFKEAIAYCFDGTEHLLRRFCVDLLSMSEEQQLQMVSRIHQFRKDNAGKRTYIIPRKISAWMEDLYASIVVQYPSKRVRNKFLAMYRNADRFYEALLFSPERAFFEDIDSDMELVKEIWKFTVEVAQLMSQELLTSRLLKHKDAFSEKCVEQVSNLQICHIEALNRLNFHLLGFSGRALIRQAYNRHIKNLTPEVRKLLSTEASVRRIITGHPVLVWRSFETLSQERRSRLSKYFESFYTFVATVAQNKPSENDKLYLKEMFEFLEPYQQDKVMEYIRDNGTTPILYLILAYVRSRPTGTYMDVLARYNGFFSSEQSIEQIASSLGVRRNKVVTTLKHVHPDATLARIASYPETKRYNLTSKDWIDLSDPRTLLDTEEADLLESLNASDEALFYALASLSQIRLVPILDRMIGIAPELYNQMDFCAVITSLWKTMFKYSQETRTLNIPHIVQQHLKVDKDKVKDVERIENVLMEIIRLFMPGLTVDYPTVTIPPSEVNAESELGRFVKAMREVSLYSLFDIFCSNYPQFNMLQPIALVPVIELSGAIGYNPKKRKFMQRGPMTVKYPLNHLRDSVIEDRSWLNIQDINGVDTSDVTTEPVEDKPLTYDEITSLTPKADKDITTPSAEDTTKEATEGISAAVTEDTTSASTQDESSTTEILPEAEVTKEETSNEPVPAPIEQAPTVKASKKEPSDISSALKAALAITARLTDVESISESALDNTDLSLDDDDDDIPQFSFDEEIERFSAKEDQPATKNVATSEQPQAEEAPVESETKPQAEEESPAEEADKAQHQEEQEEPDAPAQEVQDKTDEEIVEQSTQTQSDQDEPTAEQVQQQGTAELENPVGFESEAIAETENHPVQTQRLEEENAETLDLPVEDIEAKESLAEDQTLELGSDLVKDDESAKPEAVETPKEPAAEEASEPVAEEPKEPVAEETEETVTDEPEAPIAEEPEEPKVEEQPVEEPQSTEEAQEPVAEEAKEDASLEPKVPEPVKIVNEEKSPRTTISSNTKNKSKDVVVVTEPQAEMSPFRQSLALEEKKAQENQQQPQQKAKRGRKPAPKPEVGLDLLENILRVLRASSAPIVFSSIAKSLRKAGVEVSDEEVSDIIYNSEKHLFLFFHLKHIGLMEKKYNLKLYDLDINSEQTFDYMGRAFFDFCDQNGRMPFKNVAEEKLLDKWVKRLLDEKVKHTPQQMQWFRQQVIQRRGKVLNREEWEFAENCRLYQEFYDKNRRHPNSSDEGRLRNWFERASQNYNSLNPFKRAHFDKLVEYLDRFGLFGLFD